MNIHSPSSWTLFNTERLRKQKVQQTIFILTVLVPMVVVFALFWIYPFIGGIWGGFTQWKAFNPDQPFIGLRHYAALASDPIFQASLQNTFYYAVMYLPSAVIFALLLAMSIESMDYRLRTAYRMFYFLPVVTSTIATALIWSWLYQPSSGLFNQILELLNLPAQRFLRSPSQALPSIVLYALWKNIGFTMVLFMAGLTSINRTFYDAAKVDGANRWQEFWHITLPLLQPTMVFVVVTGVISTLQIFGPVFIMSSSTDSLPGGPVNSTMVISVYQWLVAFRELNLGYGSAMGVILFLIILLLTLGQMRFLRTRWEY